MAYRTVLTTGSERWEYVGGSAMEWQFRRRTGTKVEVCTLPTSGMMIGVSDEVEL
jgi:hypothetical protein